MVELMVPKPLAQLASLMEPLLLNPWAANLSNAAALLCQAT
jgi:hypothetical protein